MKMEAIFFVPPRSIGIIVLTLALSYHPQISRKSAFMQAVSSKPKIVSTAVCAPDSSDRFAIATKLAIQLPFPNNIFSVMMPDNFNLFFSLIITNQN